VVVIGFTGFWKEDPEGFFPWVGDMLEFVVAYHDTAGNGFDVFYGIHIYLLIISYNYITHIINCFAKLD
jgi:hypothetical protein